MRNNVVCYGKQILFILRELKGSGNCPINRILWIDFTANRSNEAEHGNERVITIKPIVNFNLT